MTCATSAAESVTRFVRADECESGRDDDGSGASAAAATAASATAAAAAASVAAAAVPTMEAEVNTAMTELC